METLWSVPLGEVGGGGGEGLKIRKSIGLYKSSRRFDAVPAM